MSYHHQRFMTPGGSRRRKARETFYSNQLLAGYMAYEFLARGTLLGQKFDPARREALALGAAGSMEVREFWKEGVADSWEPGRGGGGGKKKVPEADSYVEVASILKTEEAHIPGVVNPSQLLSWIQR